jgi:hypothetical protein
MSISRVLPSGGPMNAADIPSRSLQSIDRPNPNAKFSRMSAPKGNTSTVFNNSNAAQDAFRPGKRCAPASVAQYGAETTPRPTLRITRFDEKQSAAARVRESTFRPLRRMQQDGASGSATSSASRPISPVVEMQNGSGHTPRLSPSREHLCTATGYVYTGGRKSPGRKNAESSDAPPAAKEYASMERFKSSERTANREASVLKPETLPTHVPPFKAQRFAASPSARHDSLIGVFHPNPGRSEPPKYTPRAPYHTD